MVLPSILTCLLPQVRPGVPSRPVLSPLGAPPAAWPPCRYLTAGRRPYRCNAENFCTILTLFSINITSFFTFLNALSQYLVLTERPLKMRFFPQIARVRQFRLTRDRISPVTCLHDGSWFDQRVVWSSVSARSSSSTHSLKKVTAAVHAAREQRTKVDVVINMGGKDNPVGKSMSRSS